MIIKLLKSSIWFLRIISYRIFFIKKNISLFQRMSLSTHIELLGKNSSIYMEQGIKTRNNVSIYAHGGKISIGRGCFFNDNCHITAINEVNIGSGCCFGPNVAIFDHDHNFKNNDDSTNGFIVAPVKIGRNVWIGANCVILKGTDIGDGCVIAAGTIVKGKIPSNHLFYQKRTNEIKMI